MEGGHTHRILGHDLDCMHGDEGTAGQKESVTLYESFPGHNILLSLIERDHVQTKLKS